MMNKNELLKKVLQAIPDLELAVLVGSQASGSATHLSDWDVAVRWNKGVSAWARLERSEVVKQKIAEAMGVHKDLIDLIDMASARLALRAVIAEEGVVLKGEGTLAWSHYLTQTWGELEDYYWRKNHAA